MQPLGWKCPLRVFQICTKWKISCNHMKQIFSFLWKTWKGEGGYVSKGVQKNASAFGRIDSHERGEEGGQPEGWLTGADSHSTPLAWLFSEDQTSLWWVKGWLAWVGYGTGCPKEHGCEETHQYRGTARRWDHATKTRSLIHPVSRDFLYSDWEVFMMFPRPFDSTFPYNWKTGETMRWSSFNLAVHCNCTRSLILCT